MGKLAKGIAKKNAEEKYIFLDIKPRTILQSKRFGKTDTNKYFRLLLNFDFISLKIEHPKLGVEALIRDYDLIEFPDILKGLNDDERLNIEQIKTLKLIQGALRLSANVLIQDSKQLVGQLWGRLHDFPSPKIHKLLADAQQSKGENIWLRPITASLTTPDSPVIRTFSGHNDPVSAVAITPDGKKALSASFDNTLKLWDLVTGKEISTFTGHNNSVNAVVITPDGKKALSASFDQNLKLWDLVTGKEISTLRGHNNWVNAVAITADGKKALSASFDQNLKLWDLVTGKEISTFTGHNNSVNAVAITADGKKALSACWDETLKLWDLVTGKEISTFIGDNFISCCAVSPDGLTIVAGDNLGRVHFLRLEGGEFQ
ncbi:MAG: WD40 repeat domain-containing protein [Moorea sp. SIO2B7]|nr:WD40 repeat domain-containing protein [Moorena sp. SIO2B7]